MLMRQKGLVKVTLAINSVSSKDPIRVTKRSKEASPRLADPHRTREARKYANPIPSREFILETLTQAGVPLVFDELRQLLELDSEEDRIALERRLGAMVREGRFREDF